MIVFLPVRNGGAYLTEAIDSVRAQTVDDWRLVELENYSSDDSVARITAYEDDRISLHRAAQPLDIQPNWQRSIAYLQDHAPRDQLITFIGHDDRLAPTFVETIRRLAQERPEAGLYQTHFDMIGEAGDVLRPCRPIPATETGEDMAAQLCWNLRDSFGTGYAFRSGDFLDVGGWPDLPKLLFSDHLLFIRLAALSFKAATPDTGAFYRSHSGSASGSINVAALAQWLRALDGYVAALDTEFADFVAQDRGRDALAALLAHELAKYRLRAVRRHLDGPSKELVAKLEDRFAQVSRGIPMKVWNRLHPGNSSRLAAVARDLLDNVRFYRAMR